MGETFGHRMRELMEDHFVGREFELRFFEQFLTGMTERSERIINVYGTAGIGKSYLLERYERISRQGGAATVSIDVREAYGRIEAFCRMILFALEQDEDPGHQENVAQRAVNAINDSASKRKTVLLIDGYEEIGGLDYELRHRWLPRLDSNVLIVIAGRFPLEGPWRYSPAWKRLIARLALTELSYEDIRMYLLGLGFQDDQVIDTLWLRTLGHPLSLSLLMPDGEGGQDPLPSEWEPVDDRIHHWLQEAPDEELRQLLYACSVPRTFHQDLLTEIIGKEVTATLFSRLIGLSFMTRNARGWQLTQIVWESMRGSFKERMPETFKGYFDRTMRHYERKIDEGLRLQEERAWEVAQMMRFSSNALLRAHLRHSRESNHYLEPVDSSNLNEVKDYVQRRLRNANPLKIRCSDTESGTMFRFEMTGEQSVQRLMIIEVDELLNCGTDALQLLRSRQGEVVGVFAIVPIHGKTLNYLMNAPLSRAYFRSLDPKRIQELRTPAESPAGWYVYGIDVARLEDEQLRSDIVHTLFEKMLTGGILVQSPPPLDYYHHACEGLGFEKAQGCDHFAYGEGGLTSTFVIDTRGERLKDYLRKMIPELTLIEEKREIASMLEIGGLHELTAREREVAEQLAKGLTNAEIASILYVSEAAVKKHINTMLSKYGFKNRTQLARKILGGST